MSEEHLEPGDIVKSPDDLGLVMRNDGDSGLLVAYPGMDELTIERRGRLHYVARIEATYTDEL